MSERSETPVDAYALVIFEGGKEPGNIVRDLEKIKYVKDVCRVYGTYNALLRIQAPSEDEVKMNSEWRIKRCNGILSCLTMIVRKKDESTRF